jgi:hypothetical protein
MLVAPFYDVSALQPGVKFNLVDAEYTTFAFVFGDVPIKFIEMLKRYKLVMFSSEGFQIRQ